MSLISKPDLLTEKSNAFLISFDQWLNDYLASQPLKNNFVEKLWQSKSYSLKSGGKRFRPFLAALVFELWDVETIKIKNFCLALEMIHTYSLIHDDLPCMDNDSLRRGKPTNHIVFDEATALLAGDGLLTQAFSLLANETHVPSSVTVELLKMVSSKVGSFGMVGGQVLDMNTTSLPSLAQLETIHIMKTACLIQCATMGGAFLAHASLEQISAMEEFGLQLGLAFQIKDDLLDADDKAQDHKSYVTLLGFEKASAELKTRSVAAQAALKKLNLKTEILNELIEYNINRKS
jgi:geranylgeranyl diphosphate synthase type II